MLVNGVRMLREKYRGAFYVRTRMYGSGRGYGAAAMKVRDDFVASVTVIINGKKFWNPVPGRRVSLSSPTDPTVEHDPPVVKHWRDTGRLGDQPSRRAWFTFEGNTKSMKVIDRSSNSEVGGHGEGEYEVEVGENFKGPGEGAAE
jgi:hypothetical protein